MFRLTILIILAVTLARIIVLILSPLELYPDEAQYWWWAQSPDLGYFSKPPLIAWVIRVSTFIFGDREWAIRLPIPLLHAATSLLVYAIARTVYLQSTSIAPWSALAYLTLPGVSYSSGLASTDAPLLFFWAAALLAFLRAVERRNWRWALLCGVSVGLGVLAKYAMLFFGAGVAVAVVARPEVRKLVLSRFGAGAALAAGLVVAPNVVWNASHAFATVTHTQVNAGWSRAQFHVLHLLAFLGGQFGVFGPVLLATWFWGLWRIVRGGERSAGIAILCAMSATPFALIAVQSFVADANANWAATTYLAALPIALAELLGHWPRLILWISFVLHTGVLLLLWVVLISPPVADGLGVGNVFKRQEGWRSLAAAVSGEFARGPFDVVASDNRSITAELVYYLRPNAPPVRIWDPEIASRNQFDMTMRLTAGTRRTLVVVMPEEAAAVISTFESARSLSTVVTPVGGRHERVLRLYDAHFYRGPAIR